MTTRSSFVLILSIVTLAAACSSPSSEGRDTGSDAAMDASADVAADVAPEDALPDHGRPPEDAALDLIADATSDSVSDLTPHDAGDDTTTDIPPDTCQPDCEGKTCGDDGCGGDCGECPAGQGCVGGGCSWMVQIVAVAGQGQAAEPDRLLSPLVVRVQEQDGTPVPGVAVSFSATPGAWVGPSPVVSNPSGEAHVEARLGLAVGPYQYTAMVEGAPPILFDATAFQPDPGVIFTVVNANQENGAFGQSGPGTAAWIGPVAAVAAASDGTVFLADGDNSCSVYRLSVEGVIERVVGAGVCGFSGDGALALEAMLDQPESLALDEASGILYIADSGNGRIRAVDLTLGTIDTIAGGGDAQGPGFGDGGPADSAFLETPTGLLLGPDRGLYITSSEAPQGIRRIDPDSSVINTVVACEADPAMAISPVAAGGGMAWDLDGRLLFAGSFVGTSVNPGNPAEAAFAVARVNLDGSLEHVAGVHAGSGDEGVPATQALLSGVAQLATDRRGNLFLSIAAEHRVRRIEREAGQISTIAGTGLAGFGGDYSDGPSALLSGPAGISLDGTGSVFIADRGNHALRVVWRVGDMTDPERAADLLVSSAAMYAVTPSGNLLRVNHGWDDDPETLANESIQWTLDGGFEQVTPMHLLDGRIVACRLGALKAVAPVDGAETVSLPGVCGGAMALGETGIVYSSVAGEVRGLSLPSTVLWTATPSAGEVTALAVLDAGTVLALVGGDGVYGLEPGSGVTLWEYHCAATGGLAVGSGDRVFVAAQDGLHAIDPAFCSQASCPAAAVTDLTGYGTPGEVILVGPMERVFLLLGESGVVAVDHGNPVWFQPMTEGTAAILGDSNRLYVGTRTGAVVTLSTWWGAQLSTAEVTLSHPVRGLSFAPGGGLWGQAGPVFLETPSSSGALSQGPWPKLRRDAENHANAGLRSSCVTQCQGKVCGPDGCGGVCGDCLAGDSCFGGVCKSGGCGAVPPEGCCDGGAVVTCQAGSLQSFSCAGLPAPYNQCGWASGGGGGAYACGGSGADPSGAAPYTCDYSCVPSCTGKECGGDGCGGSCGGCQEGEQCIAAHCMSDCGSIPDVGCCLGGNALICKADEGLVEVSCGLMGCGWSNAVGGVNCGADGTPPPEYALECNPDCVPDCDGKDCGPNGCGAVCGTCAANEVCEDQVCVCVPDCFGVECGGDGCGGSCGECPAGFACVDAACECVPDCVGKGCGDDGCGGACPPGCGVGFFCQGGVCNELVSCGDAVCDEPLEDPFNCPDDCVCVPDCVGKQCGDDGCLGSCGVCPMGTTCGGGGQCVETWTDPTSGLTWQNPPFDGMKTWADAQQYCQDLALDGGGWHLPTIDELRTLVRGCPATEVGGSCNILEGVCQLWSCRDVSCKGCIWLTGPGQDGCHWPLELMGICTDMVWSSTPDPGNEDHFWFVSFASGFLGSYDGVYYSKLFRCVR